MIKLVAGGGGGGGQTNDSADDGGNGGRGSGSMLIECVGVLSITGTIHASGANG